MLELRPAIVVECDDAAGAREPAPATGVHASTQQRLLVQLTGEDRAGTRREALADTGLVGPAEIGDRVIVSVDDTHGQDAADVVHVNLTRGLAGEGASAGPRKLARTSLQHTVEPVDEERLEVPLGRPAGVLVRHGQLTSVVWAFAQAAPGARLGYVQSDGGVLAEASSRTVAALRSQGLLAGHLTAGAAFGGEGEALTLAGAIHHGVRRLGWDAVVCGPGPGAAWGVRGGVAALDAAHAALALGCPALLVARMSAAERPPGSGGLSQDTLTVLDLLLEPVTVALPAGMRSPVGSELRASLGAVFGTGRVEHGPLAPDVARPARITRHDWRRAEVDLPAFAAGPLAPASGTRAVAEDPLYYAAALAGGGVLAQLLADEQAQEPESA
jgi:hypothetical protein